MTNEAPSIGGDDDHVRGPRPERAELPHSLPWLFQTERDLREAIAARRASEPIARELSRALFAPVWERLPGYDGLRVYWDSSLPPVPLGAMPGPDGESLRLSHELRVAPLGRERGLGSPLGEGFLVVSDRGRPSTGLRGAHVESIWLRRFLTRSRWLESPLSEAELSAAVSASRAVHFGVHSGLDAAGEPGLRLIDGGPGSPADPTRDVYWSEREIRENFWPQLDLVVLAGCRTAVGARLADAFVDAGAHRVLGSLWDVNDAVTAEWMRVFYRSLTEGRSLEASVADAERWFASGRAGPLWTDPYYWAGFALRASHH